MINAPPTTSEWPLMYLVVECNTTVAPERQQGRCKTGEAKVLSTTTRTPRRAAMLQNCLDIG